MARRRWRDTIPRSNAVCPRCRARWRVYLAPEQALRLGLMHAHARRSRRPRLTRRTPSVSLAGPADGRAGLGIDALELFVEVLSQSEPGADRSDGFYDRLCEAVCRLARMRRAIIFRYDSA